MGLNRKTTKLLDSVLLGICVVIRLNTVMEGKSINMCIDNMGCALKNHVFEHNGDSKPPDQTAYPCSLIRAFTEQNHWTI